MTDLFVQRCRDLAHQSGFAADNTPTSAPETSDAESLIGIFQLFRPHGADLEALFDSVPQADRLVDRLKRVFDCAGDDRRPQGGRDVYFLVRSPKSLAVESAEHHAASWVEGLKQIAEAAGDSAIADRLSTSVKIRVLEGIPPKHPKQPEERSSLLNLLHRCAELTPQINGVDPHAELLRPAYYFMACDAMLRDYLMWPFYAAPTGLEDPLKGYFALWSHGVKYRVFREDQIDLYLPRNSTP
ncbi:MAG: hypothetical protein KDB00_16985 [Planctomycetales bacterium]|nr:hypothetical protein [Planctomycetales bacterium]